MKQKYIVLVKKGTDLKKFEKFLNKNFEVDVNFKSLKRHYMITSTTEQTLRLYDDDRVQNIESADSLLKLEIQSGNTHVTDDPNHKEVNKWNLDRINKRYPFLNGDTSFRATGKNVDIYIVDTGVDGSHPELNGRVENLFTAFGEDYEDGHGHGTHVAGTAAGNTFGVSRDAKVYNLRVLNEKGSGGLYGIICAMEKAVEHHKNKIANRINRPSVVNMSLGSARNSMVDNAVNDAIEEGMVVCIAAGNSNVNLDVAEVSPAEVLNGITVSATTRQDRPLKDRLSLGRDYLAMFSNYGSQVDICAPGQDIWSCFPDNKYFRMSGTSMASPLVAGVCAAMLEGNNIFLGVKEVLNFGDKLINNSSKDKVADEYDRMENAKAPNRMVYLERNPSVKKPWFPKCAKGLALGILFAIIFIGGTILLSQFAT
jgi:subtilisin family serine protease